MNNSVSSRHAEDRRAATHSSQPTVDIAIDDRLKLVRCVPRVAMVRTLPQAADASGPRRPIDPFTRRTIHVYELAEGLEPTTC